MRDTIEEKLSCLLGDMLSHKLCTRAQQTLNGFRHQFQEYALYEKNYLQQPRKLKTFISNKKNPKNGGCDPTINAS